MFFKKKVKNSQKQLSVCSDYIDTYEDQSSMSCKDILMGMIEQRIKADTTFDNDTFTPDDFLKMAHMLLIHTSFDLLASGELHIYTGVLNPLKPHVNTMNVYLKSMTWSLDHGFIDQSEYDEQVAYLHECIRYAG